MAQYPQAPPSYGAYDQPPQQPGFGFYPPQQPGYPPQQPGYPPQQPGYPPQQPGYNPYQPPPQIQQPQPGGYYPGQPPTQTINFSARRHRRSRSIPPIAKTTFSGCESPILKMCRGLMGSFLCCNAIVSCNPCGNWCPLTGLMCSGMCRDYQEAREKENYSEYDGWSLGEESEWDSP